MDLSGGIPNGGGPAFKSWLVSRGIVTFSLFLKSWSTPIRVVKIKLVQLGVSPIGGSPIGGSPNDPEGIFGRNEVSLLAFSQFTVSKKSVKKLAQNCVSWVKNIVIGEKFLFVGGEEGTPLTDGKFP